MKPAMKLMSRLDYVKLYAERLKKDPSLFAQQKMLIESQLTASSQIFRNAFGTDNFKENAREYLRKAGIL